MRRREFMELVAAAGAGVMLSGKLSGAEPASAPSDSKMIGMYVHECWVYNHPYTSRTWTDEDWHGYLEGLHRLGYNLVAIWPLLETMLDPLTPSDKAKLDQHRRIIAMAHKEFGMKVWIVLCANIMPIDDYARRLSFEKRPFYGSDLRVNPADPKALDAMMARRELLLRPLAQMDGLLIIDSDPGGYPGSTNKEFVNLLVRHRRLLDTLRPGAIEVVYWAWAGWPAYARYYTTGDFAWGTESEFLEALTLLKERNPEPWGLARGLEYARKLSLQSRVINFAYGAVELEPAFPMTVFGTHAGGNAYQSGRDLAPRGTMANAQTHCLQLPNTFAFAQGAKGAPLADGDYIRFANDLIAGEGERIFSGWQALGGSDSERMRHVTAQLASRIKARLEPGPLKGLLLGDANRFIKALYVMLRVKAAATDFMNASERDRPVVGPFAELVAWLERWQVVTGYDSWWNWTAGGDLNKSLQKLNVPPLTAFFSKTDFIKTGEGDTPRSGITAGNYSKETESLRLIRAMKQALGELDPPYHP